METEILNHQNPNLSKPLNQLKETFFDLGQFMGKADQNTIHYEIVDNDRSKDHCSVLYLSAISKDGSHIVKFEKAVRPTPTSHDDLEKIAKGINIKAIAGKWCW